ncbi:MAG: hypothetical protein M3R66_08025, partial [Actinomycetota bacterium]|nr:hypothetical protein [Actinomycetota bacterium]
SARRTGAATVTAATATTAATAGSGTGPGTRACADTGRRHRGWVRKHQIAWWTGTGAGFDRQR